MQNGRPDAVKKCCVADLAGPGMRQSPLEPKLVGSSGSGIRRGANSPTPGFRPSPGAYSVSARNVATPGIAPVLRSPNSPSSSGS